MDSRRNFLTKSALFAANFFALPCIADSSPLIASPRGIVIGPGAFEGDKDSGRTYYLSMVNLDASSQIAIEKFELSFYAHGVSPHPRYPNRAALFQKHGPGACEVDLKAKNVLRPIETDKSRYFYGHGAYSSDGALLFATETDISTHQLTGLITVRDADTHDYLGEFPSYGAQPHDCQLIEDGKVIAITNGGLAYGSEEPGCVSFVDVNSEQLIDKVTIESDKKNAGHLHISPKGHLAIVSAQRDGLDPKNSTGGITLRPLGGTAKLLKGPHNIINALIGETLSVFIDDKRGIVAATTPDANLLTLWDINSGELVKYFSLHNPRGVTQSLDGKFWVFSIAKPAALVFVDAESLEPAATQAISPSYMTGSHVIAHRF